MKILTKEEFVAIINDCLKQAPKSWRHGQAVFNIIDEQFGVARYVQFRKGIDCFYHDEDADAFIDASYDVWVEAVKDINNKEKESADNGNN